MAREPALEYPAEEDRRSPDDTFRVLVVSGALQIERLKGACKDVGYVVAGATTLDEAKAMLDGHDHVDVIACSAHIEGQAAMELLHCVRTSPKHADTPFLLLSVEPGLKAAFLDRTAARAGMALGASGYLVMPRFDEELLVAEIVKLQPMLPALRTRPGPG